MQQLAWSLGRFIVVKDLGQRLVVGEDMELLTFHKVAETLYGMVNGKKLPVKSTVLCFCKG